VLLPLAWLRVLPPARAWCHREAQPPYDSTSGRQLFRADRPSTILVPMTLDHWTTFRRCELRVPGSSLNHRYCETRNAFAATDCAQTFRTISLDCDRSANRA
jgi:hypothetical protein